MDDQKYKQMVKQSFDTASVGYDSQAMRFFDNSAEHLVDSLSLKGDEHILDVCAGTGKYSLRMAKQLRGGHVTGVDISEGMLAKAINKAKELGISNTTFTAMDIEELQFSTDHFDGVTCGFGVFFWPNMELGLRNIKNVIKPEGWFAMTSFLDGSFMPLSEVALNKFKEYGVEPPEMYTWARLDHPDKHKELLTSVGFSHIESHVKQVGYYLTNKEQWWELILHTGFRAFLNQVSEKDIPSFKEEHLAEIEAMMDSKGLWLNVDVIFTSAKK